jgi:hypothetical protein
MAKYFRLVPIVTIILIVVGCGVVKSTPDPSTRTAGPGSEALIGVSPEAPSSSGTGNVNRTLLTYDELMNGVDTTSPVNEDALALPEEAGDPENAFEGRLELIGENSSGEIQVITGDPDLDPESAHLPEFDFEFVQGDGYLIPVQRGLVIGDHPVWNYIIEPGRVWQEVGDGGYSRASFPFALVVKGGNSTFNGVMTFLFNDTDISKVWYQITQETSIFTRIDFWGMLDAVYHSGEVTSSDQIRESFVQERVGRFPTRPIEQLATEYPGVDVSRFGYGVTPEHMTWYGLVVEGVNYVGGCQTRYGIYPYCESMRAPSYSTSKSAFVSVAMMRLAQTHDPNVSGLLIKDYVPEVAASRGDWSNVTFDHTLDMATGNYRSAAFMADEENFGTDPFWADDFYEGKIAAAFNWPHSADPGTQWVYRTSDTFIVTRALHNYLQSQEGGEKDIFEFVVDEVYRPLKMGPGVFSTLRTADNEWQGQPVGGLGMWWIPDDIAKITTLLNVDGGAIDEVQLLQPEMLTSALQRNAADRGVSMDSERQYNNAFWANRYTEASGYDCEFWVPQMLGYSGVVVALFPNGALREADKIVPLCQ